MSRAPDDAPRRRRGGQPRISRERIIEAAYDLGIEHLTMTAVAERLGVTHQALYTWVRDRDELIELVSSLFVQRLTIPPIRRGDWRASLRAFAHDLRRLLVDIPGFAAAGLVKFRTSTEFLRLNEEALRRLVAVGFDPAAAQRIYHTFITVLLGWITREDAYLSLRADPNPIAEALESTTSEAEDRFPLVSQVALAEFLAPAEERFSFLVDTFLAGLPDPTHRIQRSRRRPGRE